MTHSILRIDTSLRRDGSTSRMLADRLVARFGADAHVVTRDLADGLPPIDAAWVDANTTPAERRSPAQIAALALSDALIAEVAAADTLIIAMPIYNFGVPAALKTWIDQIARARKTFRYTEAGPRGLLEGKRAIVAVASGGTRVGSEIDFATGWLRHVLGFVGISDVTFVTADGLARDRDTILASAEAQVATLSIAA